MSSHEIPDRQERLEAETSFDRNVVVVAGAGTGKTTLLVNRLIHLLVKEPDPIAITRLVALTFTNKAATEMKQRLRERLSRLNDPAGDLKPADGGAVSIQDLRERYGLSTEEIGKRVRAALRDLEKAQIGTLHSFAAHLLRLHPLESGVSPAFQEDDGLRFEEHFAAAWDIWIDQELGRQGSRHRQWKRLLRAVTLEDLRTFVRFLCGELIDLDLLCSQLETSPLAQSLAQALLTHRDRAQALLGAHAGPKRRKVEQMLSAAIALLTRLIEQGPESLADQAQEEREWLDKDLGQRVSGWENEEFKEASAIIDIAQQLQMVDHSFFKNLLIMIVPLVRQIRATFVQQGWLSFDSLLARARILLRDHPAVRDRIKQEYRAVLVDEFQDTDPVQYEIILAVSEQAGGHAVAWQDMALEPGKLFIVGDPKQSIYAFRRADIEAFERVVAKIESGGGAVRRLTANFRSDAAILGPVNDIFDRLFHERPHIQPGNVRLEGRPGRKPPQLDPGVRLRIVRAHGNEAFDAADAARAEAAALARWLTEEVFAHGSVNPGQVALLFRKLTQADTYLDALRRRGIAYVIEGEKHFYRRQEVIDLVNLLRVLDHPHDAIAFVGLLRSSLGGLTDRDLYDLRQAGLFDYRHPDEAASWSHPSAASVQRLYLKLSRLHRELPVLPLGDAVQRIFEALPLLELAAATLHGEQAVANLLKVKQLAINLADRPQLTLSGFADLMTQRLEDQPDEAESPLAEESPEAVQVLTIHKAKGLEFPIVVLPGLHQGTVQERSLPMVTHDWSSGLYGLALGDRQTVNSVLLGERLKIREEAERRRVLYVGMTRAKDLLVLSGGLTARTSGDSVLSLLQEIGQGELGAVSTGALTVGESMIPHASVEAPGQRFPRRARDQASSDPAIDPVSTAARWQSRESAWRQAQATPRHLTPTALTAQDMPALPRRPEVASDWEPSRLVGIVAHRILERWDFARDPSGLIDRIDPAVRSSLSAEQERLITQLTATLHEMMTAFGQSALHAGLNAATILGREVPFLMPWENGQSMTGVIDLIYRLDGNLWIADYKTDAVASDEAPARAERYRTQGEIYKQAVRQCLGIGEVRVQCFFLRCATAIEL